MPSKNVTVYLPDNSDARNDQKNKYFVCNNKYPPAKPVVFHFRAISPNITSGAQDALITTWQSCDCYLPPVNGHSLCLTFFSYAFAPLFWFLIFIFPFIFLSLLFLLFLPYFLMPFLLLFFVHRQSLSWTRRLSAGFALQKRASPEGRRLSFTHLYRRRRICLRRTTLCLKVSAKGWRAERGRRGS